MKKSSLTIRAGRQALSALRNGFSADLFSTLLGASGGPKWLVLAAIDRVLARRLVAARTTPLHAFGTSIGAFRHTALAQSDPVAAIDRFLAAYVAQAYETKPTAAEVSEQSRIILDVLLDDNGTEVLEHPFLRLHVGTVRGRGPVATDQRAGLLLGLGAAATANALSRRLLGYFFERVVFHSTSDSVFTFHDLATRQTHLNSSNLRDATLASGSIPMVMAALRDIAGAPSGLYRDGGITDYHFDLDFDAPAGLILYPHFFDRITPGWFDKALPWRRASGALRDRTLFISPSPEFVASLPRGKVPDRADFTTHSTAERQRRWQQVGVACERLGDELEELMEGTRLAEAARPFPA